MCLCVCRNDILQKELGQYRANLKEAKKQINKMEQEQELIRGFEDSDILPLPLHQKVNALVHCTFA